MSRIPEISKPRYRTTTGGIEQASGQDAVKLAKKESTDVSWTVMCPVCASSYALNAPSAAREGKRCLSCGATGRTSAIVQFVDKAAFDDDLPTIAHKPNKNIRVIGLSDWSVYGNLFDELFDYTNIFYHKTPYLDALNPSKEYIDSADIFISSEVLVHVVGDYRDAFRGAFAILKRGGTFMFTVLYHHFGELIERYPNSIAYVQTTGLEGERIVEMAYAGETKRIEHNARFHGGWGATLEMRILSKYEILRCLEEAGLIDINFREEDIEERGIYWDLPSRSITARKPS